MQLHNNAANLNKNMFDCHNTLDFCFKDQRVKQSKDTERNQQTFKGGTFKTDSVTYVPIKGPFICTCQSPVTSLAQSGGGCSR